jgi:hypothetical protein
MGTKGKGENTSHILSTKAEVKGNGSIIWKHGIKVNLL